MRIFFLSMPALLILTASVAAHNFPCGHDHLEGADGQVFLDNTCNDQPGSCSSGCFQVTTRNDNTYCTCSDGDCETAFAGTFVAETLGPLEPNTTRTFSITTETIEALSVLVEEMEVASFGPNPEDTFGPADFDALFGSTTLEIGDFSDPEAIPVTVTAFHVDLISLAGDGKESGENQVDLRDGQPIDMLYNATTNSFSLADQSTISIKLELENDLAGHQPATLFFDGRFDADNNLAVFGQITVGDIVSAVLEHSWGKLKSSSLPTRNQEETE